MVYKLSDIQQLVKDAIDEIAPNDAEHVSGQDNVEMNTIIVDNAAEAADYVHANAEAALIAENECTPIDYPSTSHPNAFSLNPATGATEKILEVKLMAENIPTTTPETTDKSLGIDFLRLIYADVYGVWAYPIATPIASTDTEYPSVTDPYIGASSERPAITIAHQINAETGEVYLVMQFRKLTSSEDVAHALVMERAKVQWYTNDTTNVSNETIHSTTTEYQGIEVNSHLYPAFIYRLAGLLLLTYRSQHATNMFSLADTLIGKKQEHPS